MIGHVGIIVEFQPPPLDLPKAMTLVGGDRALLVELAALFLVELPTMLGELEAAIRADDAPKTRTAAHRLKGALVNLGATAAYDLAYELERLGGSATLETAPALLDALQCELRRLGEFLSAPEWTDRA
jgi:HPt (histidine-containing phosphotransfer) domain-containing protein